MRAAVAGLVALAATGAAAEPALTFGDLSVKFYGHVNVGILRFSDGAAARTWGLVDNDHSSSRAGVEASLRGDAVDLRARFEVEYQPRPSDALSLAEGAGWDWSFGRRNIRLLETVVEHEGWGALSLGQGDMASEDVVEDTDLSGTALAAQAAAEDHAAAQVFRLRGGSLSETPVGDAFSAPDGLGRAVRIRYDTPRVEGVRGSVSWGQDRLVGRSKAQLVDLALRYNAERGDAEWLAAAGIGWEDGERVLAGAVSGLHTPTGLSLTLAGGERGGRYGWAKLGWQGDLHPAGRTYLSLDHLRAADQAEAGGRSRFWGVAAVQVLDDWNTELWLTVRRYAYSASAIEYRPGHLVFGGVRWTF